MSAGPPKSTSQRPTKLQTSKSFTRFEPTVSSPKRSRASTLANEVLPDTPSSLPATGDSEVSIAASPSTIPASSNTSVFEKPVDDSDAETPIDRQSLHTLASPLDNLPPDFDALPIEIASWSDRFVADLTNAKVFPQPPTIDTLSDIFQEFYTKAEDRIGTHIKTLATRQSRNNSPARKSVRRPRASPRLGSAASRDELRRSSGIGEGVNEGGQPMLTAGEVHEKRKAKKLLEYKRQLLEEAVERRVTEALYLKIWRHNSSLDEVKDDKLRGKTGSLQLVGIGLKELGVDLNPGVGDSEGEQTTAERAVMIEEWISKAGEGLLKMNTASCPKGKLDELIAAHQKIVDLLTKVHRGSSSADEILPTLIYTLIACPAEGLNIVSNMNFIQRFRASSKMNGEAAYCLTNLEAAVTFLETVDLASLRSEQAVESSPDKQTATQPVTPVTATFSPQLPISAGKTTAASTIITADAATTATQKGVGSKETSAELKPLSRPSSSQAPRSAHHRRLSSLMAIPTSAFNSANEVVRSTAEESIKSVSTTLDSSFKLLFGRLRERQVAQDAEAVKSPIVVPKTLDEARKLVTPKLGFDDDGASENSSVLDADDDHPLKEREEGDESRSDDRMLGLIAGRGKNAMAPKPRDRSADSKASDASSIRTGKASFVASPAVGPPGPGALDNAAEAFRSLGNSFNPLNRLSGTGFMNMRSFGRTNTPPTNETGLTPPREQELKDTSKMEPTTTNDGQFEASGRKLSPPPMQRFLEIADASDLKVGELQDLLSEYRRVVDCLRQNGLV